MKKITTIAAVCLILGCTDSNGQKEAIRCYQDSLNSCMQAMQFSKNPTPMAEKGLVYLEKIMKLDKGDGNVLFRRLNQKSQLLFYAGRSKECIETYETAINMLDKDNIYRLQYYAAKTHFTGSDQAQTALANFVDGCDKLGNKEEGMVLKVQTLYIIGKTDEARKILKAYLRTHKNSPYKELLEDNFGMFQQIRDYMTKMFASIK